MKSKKNKKKKKEVIPLSILNSNNKDRSQWSNSEWIYKINQLHKDSKKVEFTNYKTLPAEIKNMTFKPLDILMEFVTPFEDYIKERELKWLKKNSKNQKESGKGKKKKKEKVKENKEKEKRYRNDLVCREYFKEIYNLAERLITSCKEPLNFYTFFEMRHYFNEHCYLALYKFEAGNKKTIRSSGIGFATLLMVKQRAMSDIIDDLKKKIMVHNKLHSTYQHPWGDPVKLLGEKMPKIQIRAYLDELKNQKCLIYRVVRTKNDVYYYHITGETLYISSGYHSCDTGILGYRENFRDFFQQTRNEGEKQYYISLPGEFKKSRYKAIASSTIKYKEACCDKSSVTHLETIKMYFNMVLLYYRNKNYRDCVDEGIFKKLYDLVKYISELKIQKTEKYFEALAPTLTNFSELIEVQLGASNKNKTFKKPLRTIFHFVKLVVEEISNHIKLISDATLAELILFLNHKIVCSIVYALKDSSSFYREPYFKDAVNQFVKSITLLEPSYSQSENQETISSGKIILRKREYSKFYQELKDGNYKKAESALPEIEDKLENHIIYQRLIKGDQERYRQTKLLQVKNAKISIAEGASTLFKRKKSSSKKNAELTIVKRRQSRCNSF